MKKEEIQEKYLQLQMLDKQIKEMHRQLQLFKKQGQEITGTVNSLDEFKKTKRETPILVPISSGIFAKAKLEKSSELLMNVGSDVVVSKNVDDAKELLSKQVEKIKKLQEQLSAEINSLVVKAVPLQEEVNTFIEGEKRKESKEK